MGGALTRMLGLRSAAASGLQFVGGYTSAVANTGTTTISLTSLTGGLASSPSQDDIVIVAFVIGAGSDRTPGVSTSGYNEVDELYVDGANDANLSVSWKIMGVSPDTSVDVTGRELSTFGGAVAIHVWRGVNTSIPFDVLPVYASSTASGQPDPASITPISAGSEILCIGAASAAILSTFTSSDLSNFISAADANTFDAGVGIGSKSWSGSGAFDGASWGGGAASSATWISLCLALRPASSTATGITFVGRAVGVASGTGDQVVSLTALTGGVGTQPATDDFVVAVHTIGGAASRTMNATGNNSGAYTTEYNTYQNGTNDTNFLVAYKKMGATPDTSVTLKDKVTSSYGSSWVIYVFRGVNTTTPLDVTSQTATAVNIGQPDPPSITPVTAGSMVVACGGASGSTCNLFTSSDLQRFISSRDDQSFDGTTGVGLVPWTGGAVDPAAWGGGQPTSSGTMAALTMVLRPA